MRIYPSENEKFSGFPTPASSGSGSKGMFSAIAGTPSVEKSDTCTDPEFKASLGFIFALRNHLLLTILSDRHAPGFLITIPPLFLTVDGHSLYQLDSRFSDYPKVQIRMFPKKEELENAKVYKFVASGSNNKLAMLVGVISSDPEKTLENYLKHASVEVVEQPTHLPDRDPLKVGIDLFIGQRDDKPGYAILNRMPQSFFEGMLTDDTKMKM